LPDNIPPVLRTEEGAAGSASTYRVCDFCKCTIAQSGEVLKMSDTAKEYREQKEVFEKRVAKDGEEKAALKNRVEELERENATLRKAAEPQPQPEEKKFSFI
jgi:hypothetical protein